MRASSGVWRVRGQSQVQEGWGDVTLSDTNESTNEAPSVSWLPMYSTWGVYGQVNSLGVYGQVNSLEVYGQVNSLGVYGHVKLRLPIYLTCAGIQVFITQSKVVAQLTLLVAMTVLHRSCSVAAEPLHR